MTREEAINKLEHLIFSPVGREEMEETCYELMRYFVAQEPVAPIENAGFYYCGACRYAFTSARQKYCSECGREVKWE